MSVTKQWLQMGVELEGSWTESRKTIASKIRGAQAHDDRSVHIGTGNPGEIVTRPHDTMEELLRDVVALWPDVVNDSCGFHIHASFHPMKASLIATTEFYSYFKQRWEDWGKKMKLPRDHDFWNRLKGGSKFARDNFDPVNQLTPLAGRGESRYTILNFHAWEKHKTIECRLLPMFSDKEMGVKAIVELGDIYDTYLSSHTLEPVILESAVEVVGEMVIETYEMKLPDTSPVEYKAEGYIPALAMGKDVYYSIPGAMDMMLPYKEDTGKSTP